MCTYTEIQAYIAGRYGWVPRAAWIADVRERRGSVRTPAPDRAGDGRAGPCPEDKLEAIEEALRLFKMIP